MHPFLVRSSSSIGMDTGTSEMEIAAKEQRHLFSSDNSDRDPAIVDMIHITGIRKGEVRINLGRQV